MFVVIGYSSGYRVLEDTLSSGRKEPLQGIEQVTVHSLPNTSQFGPTSSKSVAHHSIRPRLCRYLVGWRYGQA